MASTTADSLRVRSADGTELAVFVSGQGSPLVLVHGTTSDHAAWRLVGPLLEPEFTIHVLDRRGRGESGDGKGYSLEREYADLAAVIDAAATAHGSPVDVLGHSYGGNVAFGTASLAPNIRRLVLYEGWPPPNLAHRSTAPEAMAELEALLAAGRAEQALEQFFRDTVLMTDAEIAALKAAPTWPRRVAATHTVPRELRAFGAQAFDPVQAAGIDVPVLLLVGTESPEEIRADPEIVAAALPDARIQELSGQAHMAHLEDPEALARAVRTFLLG